MTFKDLQRIMLTSENRTEDSPAMKELLKRTRDKRFWWIGNAGEHSRRFKQSNGNCCWSHIIGLPTPKLGLPTGFFDYQYSIYKALFIPSFVNFRSATPEEEEKYKKLMIEAELKSQTKKGNIKQTHAEVLAQKSNELIYPFKVRHVAVLKASKIGITEFCLRIIAWLCTRNNDLQGSQMIIFTGPRLELAVSLLNRLKDLFKVHGIEFTDKETVLNLNGVRIECFPSHHASAARGLPNVSLIFADECSFFPDHERDNVMDIMLRNVPLTNPYLIAVSTPQKPGDFMDQIMKQPYQQSPWKKIMIHWTEALGKLYTQADIDKVKGSRSFQREFCLQFQGIIGNVFSPRSIEDCQKIECNADDIIPGCKVSIGIDPSFGSKFGIVCTRFVGERIQVFIAEEYERPLFESMLDRIWEIKRQHKIDDNNLTIYVDAANPEIWQSLKRMLKEDYSENYVFGKLAYYKKNNINPANYMKVIPTPFNTHGAKMLQHTKSLLEDKDNLIVIDKRFDKLLTSLRTAVANEYKLDKEQTSYHDLLDAFRLSLQLYERKDK